MSHRNSEPHPQPEPQPEARTRRCRHIHTAGHQCGSPCLRTEQFCYFHHTTRRPVSDPKARRARKTTYELPVPEDRDSIRAAIAQVMHDVANNHIDPRRAGLVLYSLQLAIYALPKEPRMPERTVSISAVARSPTHRTSKPTLETAAAFTVEDHVVDKTYGLIAPEISSIPIPKKRNLPPRRTLAMRCSNAAAPPATPPASNSWRCRNLRVADPVRDPGPQRHPPAKVLRLPGKSFASSANLFVSLEGTAISNPIPHREPHLQPPCAAVPISGALPPCPEPPFTPFAYLQPKPCPYLQTT